MFDTIIDIEEASEILGCDPALLHNLVWSGAGPKSIDPRKKMNPRFYRNEVESWKEIHGAKDGGEPRKGKYAGVIIG